MSEHPILSYERELKAADLRAEPDTSAILEKYLDDALLMIGPDGKPVTKTFIVDAHRCPSPHVLRQYLGTCHRITRQCGEGGVHTPVHPHISAAGQT